MVVLSLIIRISKMPRPLGLIDCFAIDAGVLEEK
jgi:hypothetical protein